MTSTKEQIQNDLRFSGLSTRELARKYGCTQRYIALIKQQYQIDRVVPTAINGSRTLTEVPCLSSFHVTFGLNLTKFRGKRLVSEVARLLGVGRQTVRQIEQGKYDFTVTQLQKFVEVMGLREPSLPPFLLGGSDMVAVSGKPPRKPSQNMQTDIRDFVVETSQLGDAVPNVLQTIGNGIPISVVVVKVDLQRQIAENVV